MTSQTLDALAVTRILKGKWHGSYGTAACPVCQPEARWDQSALTLSDSADGRLLAHCKKLGCAFADVLAAAGVVRGSYQSPDPAVLAHRRWLDRVDKEKRGTWARRLWEEAEPIAGTIAERYVRRRAITCALPPTLRFHPACWHPSSQRLPALVALVEGGKGFGVHRTYLLPDGSGKAAVSPPKASLGCINGGAVRLSSPKGPLVVAEGIETALSLACGLLSGPATIWAALSTSGVRNLQLPLHLRRLTIAVDGDQAGRQAALDLAHRAGVDCWEVGFLNAPEGEDWSDVLRGRLGGEVDP